MTDFKELCRQRGHDFLIQSKDKGTLVEGVVPTYAAGFSAGVLHVLDLLRSREFQTNWMKGLTGDQTADVVSRILELKS